MCQERKLTHQSQSSQAKLSHVAGALVVLENIVLRLSMMGLVYRQ